MVWFAVFLLAFVLALHGCARSRETTANATYPPQGRVVDVDGTPVHVLIAGTGPDLVLLHGASGNVRDWTMDFVDRVSDRYRVIMFDRPGLGWTGRLAGKSGAWNARAESPAEQAALLQKAAAIVGIEQPVVVGHSFGGAVALAWALGQPEETGALVLLGAVSNPWPGSLGWPYTLGGTALGGALLVPAISAFVPKSYVNASVEAIFAPQKAPQGYAEMIGADLVLRRESLRANCQQVNSLRPHIVKMSKRYETLNLPVEILHGDADTIVPLTVHAKPLAEQITNAQLTTLRGIGHMPHHSAPDAVEDAIDRATQRAGLR
ncbi:alpha/beta fold hydrolase [Sulfitobacter donghicola]|uniref:Alpha/beta hydrolase n=1 Tax=Sulfitobacter donghicola DSW-25 = KCTC 12864 = JCM 14565 TaxID=1300350 RepID=A0A073IF49_9RHOB|nr:alpha/beta hydrolase [Sulfitobacter donghicola]KEJ88394.1 alpha/beta hydrolase [Sulfitobacter donghicola DSW-25 = KCTC 12864 = JCM 14565]KIN69741.1 Alpha/beta hydrolase [Sulfitobacter donghicola DSW-25 = KCTC 12864 = JCM 14565]